MLLAYSRLGDCVLCVRAVAESLVLVHRKALHARINLAIKPINFLRNGHMGMSCHGCTGLLAQLVVLFCTLFEQAISFSCSLKHIFLAF